MAPENGLGLKTGPGICHILGRVTHNGRWCWPRHRTWMKRWERGCLF